MLSIEKKRVLSFSLALGLLTLLTIILISAKNNGSAATNLESVGRNESVHHGAASLLLRPPPKERIEVEPVTLRPQGFEPSSLTRRPGRFLLAVDNRSHEPDLEFRLTGVNGNLQAGRRMRGRELRWRQLMDLPPGDYVLTVVNHSQWRYEIAITPH